MKKTLFWILIGILSFIPIISTNNIAFAQEETAEKIWITLKEDCLLWMCKWAFDYKKIVGFEEDQPDITATSIAQDVILAATYMVWTVLTLVIIYCWLMYIFAARWGKDTNAYKRWLISAAIWAVLVRWAYAIVRLIQYIAKW